MDKKLFKYLRISLGIIGVNINDYDLKKCIEVYELIKYKKGRTNLKDLAKIEINSRDDK